MNQVDPQINTLVHLVKFEDLNHHRTLFAGRCAEWMVEACFIAAARQIGRPEDVVCVNVHRLSFNKPGQRGDILEFRSQVVHLGGKSLTVFGAAYGNTDEEPMVTCYATFVTVNHEGKSYAHGLSLSPAFIEANKTRHEEAEKLRAR